jgi:hypothetical protein
MSTCIPGLKSETWGTRFIAWLNVWATCLIEVRFFIKF